MSYRRSSVIPEIVFVIPQTIFVIPEGDLRLLLPIVEVVRIALIIISLTFAPQIAAQTNAESIQSEPTLRSRIEASPTLPFHAIPFVAQSTASGAVSGVAIATDGTIYEFRRGANARPILVLNRSGKLLRSWGYGDFTIPHTIRIDPTGNIWTVDAASSTAIKFSMAGKRLLTIHVGGQPDNGSSFNGTTDVAFAPNGHLFITDGYGNARVLEYSPEGKLLKQWGKHGSRPGELNLPHSIQIDAEGTIYIADRENGRIEEFGLDGTYLREIPHLGRIYSIKLSGEVIWATMEPFKQDPGSGNGWIVELDRQTGRILGHLDVPQARAGHSLDLTSSGEPIITEGSDLLWFKADKP